MSHYFEKTNRNKTTHANAQHNPTNALYEKIPTIINLCHIDERFEEKENDNNDKIDIANNLANAQIDVLFMKQVVEFVKWTLKT